MRGQVRRAAGLGPLGAMRPRVDVDLGALQDNYRYCRRALGRAEVGAVVKADAYGLGIARVGQALAEAGCGNFWVADFDEGLALRDVLPEARIFVLQGLSGVPPEAFRQAALLPVAVTVDELYQLAAGGGGPVAVMLDCGLTRLGLLDGEARALWPSRGAATGPLASLEVVSWVTQLAGCDSPGDPRNGRQLSRFRGLLAVLPPALPSVATTLALALPDLPEEQAEPGGPTEIGRVGSGLYASQAEDLGPQPLKPVARVLAPILRDVWVPSGTAVGYDGRYVTRRSSRILTLAMGYAQGLPSSLSDGGRIFAGGGTAPLVGRVSMTLAMADATDIQAPPLSGQEAEIVGPNLSLQAQAKACGLIPNELLLALARGQPKSYRAQKP